MYCTATRMCPGYDGTQCVRVRKLDGDGGGGGGGGISVGAVYCGAVASNRIGPWADTPASEAVRISIRDTVHALPVYDTALLILHSTVRTLGHRSPSLQRVQHTYHAPARR